MFVYNVAVNVHIQIKCEEIFIEPNFYQIKFFDSNMRSLYSINASLYYTSYEYYYRMNLFNKKDSINNSLQFTWIYIFAAYSVKKTERMF